MRIITQAEFITFEENNIRLIRKGNKVMTRILMTEDKIKKILDEIKLKIMEL